MLFFSGAAKASAFVVLPDDTTKVATPTDKKDKKADKAKAKAEKEAAKAAAKTAKAEPKPVVVATPVAQPAAQPSAKSAAKARKQENDRKAKERKEQEEARRKELQKQIHTQADTAVVQERKAIKEKKATAKRNKVIADSTMKEEKKVARKLSRSGSTKGKKTKVDYSAKKAQKRSIDSLWASRDTVNKQMRDSLRLAADSVLMPHRKYVRWSKYYRDKDKFYQDARDTIDTRILHYIYTDSTRLDERNHNLYVEDVKFKSYNKARSTAINVYDAYVRESDTLLLKALSSDSAVLAARYPGKNRGNMLWRRYNKREHDLWRYLEQQRRSNMLTDDPEATKANIREFIKLDSTYTFWNDSLKARNFFQQFSFRFNAVSWALGVPHVGVEFDVTPKASNRVSLMLEGYYKPRSAWGTNNRRFTYNVGAVAGEIRYYWRTGGKQTIQRTVDNKNYGGTHGLKEFHNYKLGQTVVKDGKETIIGIPDYKIASRYNLTDSLGKIVGDKTDTINTHWWLWRLWQPARYKLTGRYVAHPRVKNLYYVGLRGGFEQYHWQLGPKGHQGKDVYAAVTFGVVRTLARFNNGSYLNLDMGGGIGVEYASYSKLGYNTETNCYVFQEHTGRHFTPYPVVKDLHVSLVYSFRSADQKTHNIFGVKRFEEKVMRADAHNNRVREHKRSIHALKESKKIMKRKNRKQAKAESKAAKVEKDAKKATKKANREADKNTKAEKKAQGAEKKTTAPKNKEPKPAKKVAEPKKKAEPKVKEPKAEKPKKADKAKDAKKEQK